MDTKSILVNTTICVVGGAAAGLLAFFCLPVTAPIALATGLVGCGIIAGASCLNALYNESQIRAEFCEKNAQKKEKSAHLDNKNCNNDKQNVSNLSKNSGVDGECTQMQILDKLNSMQTELILCRSELGALGIKVDDINNKNGMMYSDVKTTIHHMKSQLPGNGKANTQQETNQDVPISQSTALGRHGVFASANDEQINQTNPLADTSNTTKKRPLLRNG